jgi:hypothetical protein
MQKEELIFESFNAKNIPNSKISRSFISNDEFFQIAKNNHTLVMGPRGCGKTTMFKMLTAPAMNNWNTKNEREGSIKKNLPFIAIYIPADEIWQEQIKVIEDKLDEFPAQWERIKECIFTTNVFISFIKSIREYLQEFKQLNSPEKEARFCQYIFRAFLIEDSIPTLKVLQSELELRFNSIFVKFKRIIDLGETEFDDYYRLDFLKALRPVCTQFESIYEQNEKRWALCFDELELVPEDIFLRLLKFIRAVPEQFLFKLSTAPTLSFDFLENTDSPTAKRGHDYDNVSMWPDTADKADRYRIFCKELALQRISEILNSKYSIDIGFNLGDIFGEFDYLTPLGLIKSIYPSDFGVPFSKLLNRNAKQYEQGSLEWLAFREYAYIDKDFAEYLEDKKISSVNPIASAKNKDEVLRKITEIVFNRLIFFRYKVDQKGRFIKTKLGGNSNPRFYFGTKTILKIVDGNPRYLIGLIDSFEKHIKYEQHKGLLSQVSPDTQNTIIVDTANHLFNKFKSVPLVRKNSELELLPKKGTHLSKIIQDIGEYFEKRINNDRLGLDPPSCFVMDKRSTENKLLREQIKKGVYLGAFIGLPKNSKELDSYEDNLQGERYRLTYLLSPFFDLPLRQYKSISLDKCLNNESTQSNQLELN